MVGLGTWGPRVGIRLFWVLRVPWKKPSSATSTSACGVCEQRFLTGAHIKVAGASLFLPPRHAMQSHLQRSPKPCRQVHFQGQFLGYYIHVQGFCGSWVSVSVLAITGQRSIPEHF